MSSCAKSLHSFVPSSLTEIFRFDEMLRSTLRHNPGHKLVLCTNSDSYVQTKTVFLTGCYLIMTHDFTSKQTSEVFKHLNCILPSFEEFQSTSLPCCWMSLYRAKCLGWINFGDIFDIGREDSIFIEEYMHYARQIPKLDRCHPHTNHPLTIVVLLQPHQWLRLHRRARPLYPLPRTKGRHCKRRHVGRYRRRPPLQRRLLRRPAAGPGSHPGIPITQTPRLGISMCRPACARPGSARPQGKISRMSAADIFYGEGEFPRQRSSGTCAVGGLFSRTSRILLNGGPTEGIQ